jgi:parvulin-like peptidyl-prolyl isomerase
MNRAVAVWMSIAVGCVGGICCAQLAARSVVLRDKLGIIFGHGHLLALVHGHGLYQSDLDRRLAETHYLAGSANGEVAKAERQSALTDLIANAALGARANEEKIPRTDVKRELGLLRWQFANVKIWSAALQSSRLNEHLVSQILWANLRSRQCISKRIAHDVDVAEDECRRFYDSHPEKFFVSERLRVSHLFLAAPPETPPEIVESKRIAIEALSVRLVAGEDFAKLTAKNSEDEATKLRGGDLDYFSANRMPPDFVEAAHKLRLGEISKPIRTRLGFHILKSIDVQAARQKTFDEARTDIAIELANQKRAAAVPRLIDSLASPLVNPLGLSRPRRSAPAGSVVDLSSQAGYLRSL